MVLESHPLALPVLVHVAAESVVVPATSTVVLLAVDFHDPTAHTEKIPTVETAVGRGAKRGDRGEGDGAGESGDIEGDI